MKCHTTVSPTDLPPHRHFPRCHHFPRPRISSYRVVVVEDAARNPIRADFNLEKRKKFAGAKSDNLPDLRHRIEAAVGRITSDTLNKIWDELTYRLDECRVTNGVHIQHLWIDGTTTAACERCGSFVRPGSPMKERRFDLSTCRSKREYFIDYTETFVIA
ncbi:hypothetical protein TNCV_1460221 [Trichonephila clavipes]|nr:hypothetical protein TNCV_1460221 [Trichonephila clavipes]